MLSDISVFIIAILIIAVVALVIIGRMVVTSTHLANDRLAAVQESTAMSTALTQEKLDDIHELVNSRLSAALEKINSLESRLQALTGEEPTGEPPLK